MDFTDIFNMLNRDRKRKSSNIEFNPSDIIDDVKLISIQKIKKFCKDINTNIELKNFLLEFKKSINNILNSVDEIISKTKINNQKTLNTCLKVQLHVSVSIIDEIIKEIKKNKNFKFDNYINNYIKDVKNKLSTSQSNFNKSKISKKNDKKKNELDEEDEINEDDEEDLADDEENDDVEEDDEEEYDDRDDDDDDGDNDDDNDDDDVYDDKSRMRLLRNKPREDKDFMAEILKSSTTDTNHNILSYFSELKPAEKTKSLNLLKKINNYQNTDMPLLFKIINMDIPLSPKNYILKKYLMLVSSKESNKLKSWIDAVMSIPFGIYSGIKLKSFNTNQIKTFLNNLQKIMDNAVWGHNEAKRHIIQIMGQKFRNSEAKGNMIGLYGPPGNGKTSLIKEGIAKAMNKPFIFISLGGATDASFLEGHSYTYEGSIYGRIANGLINAKCMDPIIYFDELDKISNTPKGEEITNILVHLTDPVQNSHFRDKYFHGIDIDLSKATFIFSFNNPALVDRVLMDRITCIETKYLLINQKIHIAKNYLLKEILKEVGLDGNDLNISDDLIKYIIERYTNEGGVRKLKSLLFSIVRELNIANLTKQKIDNRYINFPYTLSDQNIKTIFKNKSELEFDKIHKENKYGVVNGLFASTMGIGGVLPIEILWIPSSVPLEVKATGHLQQVIKESTQVACTLAWNLLSSDKQEEYMKSWKEKSVGFHIHCPDGSTPKDGPSAGAALTLAIYSMLTKKKIRYDLALTGEINLQGNVTAIGGLEEKLEGAKRAGIKVVLYPKENQKDIDKIKERNVSLIDIDFTVISVENINQVLENALV